MGTLLRKLLIPGFVPLSQGNKFIGILWLLGALSGYGWFIVPGLIIHFIYIYKYCWKEVKLLIKGNRNAEHLASQVEQIAQKQSENIKKFQAVGEQSSFEDAVELANNEKFYKAIAILEKIPANSELYQQAQGKITEYRIKSQQNELDKAIELANNNNFEKAIATLKKIPASSELYQQAQDKITEYQNIIDDQKRKKLLEAQQQQLDKGIELASNNNYEMAIIILQKIPTSSELYQQAQGKITEYRIKSQQNELDKAIELANNNNFEKAIATLKKIPASSELYQQAQDKITEYQNIIDDQKRKKLLEAQQQQLDKAIELASNNNYEMAIIILKKIPTSSELYQQAQDKITEYQNIIDDQKRKKLLEAQQQQLDKGIELASNNNYEMAIIILQKIPANSELYQQAQGKITEYRIKSQQNELERAIELANNNNFEKAIATLKKIPTSSELYQQAQDKITEYQNKLDDQKKKNLLESQQQELDKAIELASNNNYEMAITTLEKIPASSELYQQAQDKITEYQNKLDDQKRKKLLEAQQQELDKAIELASNNNYEMAIIILQKIPANSELYQQAQAKITECQNKLEEERKKRQAEAGGRAIEVIQIFERNGLSTRNPICETINGRIIVIRMNLSNTSKKSGNFQFSQFQLIDSDKCVYNELLDMTYTMWRQEKGFGSRSDDYFPGEIRQDAAAFRVSPTAKDFSLKWNGKTIKLWL
jgi:tetratricopeptide (TPR) repeat protein